MSSNNRARSVAPWKRGDRRIPAAWAGYRDALAGRPYDYSWDDRHISLGEIYASFRLAVVEARRRGLRLPGWNTPSQVPPALIEFRKGMAVADTLADAPPTYPFLQWRKTLRPQHLVDADLAVSLRAAGLGALAPEPTVETY